MAFVFGLVGAIVSLVGWFCFESELAVFVGTGLYLLETAMEWKNLNFNAKKLEIAIVIVGCIAGAFIKSIPWYICGLLAINFYGLIISVGSVILLLVLGRNNSSPHVDFLSMLSLLGSILGAVSYGLVFSNRCPIVVFVCLALLSIILPVVAKKHRENHNNKGKWMEIVAIIIGGFNFYCVIFALTNISVYVGYLGWIVCGIVYKFIAKQSCGGNKEQSLETNVSAYNEDHTVIDSNGDLANQDNREFYKTQATSTQMYNINDNERTDSNISVYSPYAKPDDKTQKKNTALVVALIVACLIIVILAVVILVQSITNENRSTGSFDQVTVENENISTPQENIEVDPVPAAARSVLYLEIYDEKQECIGTASGFLVDNQTTLVTNYHVIQDAYSVVGWTQDNQSVEANLLIAYDEVADLAVLRCASSVDAAPLNLANSDEVFQGMPVYAVGYPLGLANTLSDGIISARYIDEFGNDILQTTAAVSSGNSGGPLLNENGQVTGVICACYAEGQNLNLAVSANILRHLIDQTTSEVYLSDWVERPLMPDQIAQESSDVESDNLPIVEEIEDTPEVSVEVKQENTSAPTNIYLNVESCFVPVGQTIELVATVEPSNATANITWSSSIPEHISVDNGTVTIHSTGAANAVITAQTDTGLTAECTVFVKQNYQPYQSGSGGLVYAKYADILCVENIIADDQNYGFWYEFYSEDTKTHFYTYQAKTADKSAEYVLSYVDFLINRGYSLSGYNAEAFLYNLTDPSGEYAIHVRKEEPYYAHTFSVWIWLNE